MQSCKTVRFFKILYMDFVEHMQSLYKTNTSTQGVHGVEKRKTAMKVLRQTNRQTALNTRRNITDSPLNSSFSLSSRKKSKTKNPQMDLPVTNKRLEQLKAWKKEKEKKKREAEKSKKPLFKVCHVTQNDQLDNIFSMIKSQPIDKLLASVKKQPPSTVKLQNTASIHKNKIETKTAKGRLNFSAIETVTTKPTMKTHDKIERTNLFANSQSSTRNQPVTNLRGTKVHIGTPGVNKEKQLKKRNITFANTPAKNKHLDQVGSSSTYSSYRKTPRKLKRDINLESGVSELRQVNLNGKKVGKGKSFQKNSRNSKIVIDKSHISISDEESLAENLENDDFDADRHLNEENALVCEEIETLNQKLPSAPTPILEELTISRFLENEDFDDENVFNANESMKNDTFTKSSININVENGECGSDSSEKIVTEDIDNVIEFVEIDSKDISFQSTISGKSEENCDTNENMLRVEDNGEISIKTSGKSEYVDGRLKDLNVLPDELEPQRKYKGKLLKEYSKLEDSSEIKEKNVKSFRKTPRKLKNAKENLKDSVLASNDSNNEARKTPRKLRKSEAGKPLRKTPKEATICKDTSDEEITVEHLENAGKSPRSGYFEEDIEVIFQDGSETEAKNVKSFRKSPKKSRNVKENLKDPELASNDSDDEVRKTPRKLTKSEAGKPLRKTPKKATIRQYTSDEDITVESLENAGKSPESGYFEENIEGLSQDSSETKEKNVKSFRKTPRKSRNVKESLEDPELDSNDSDDEVRKTPGKLRKSESEKPLRKTPKEATIRKDTSDESLENAGKSLRRTPRKRNQISESLQENPLHEVSLVENLKNDEQSQNTRKSIIFKNLSFQVHDDDLKTTKTFRKTPRKSKRNQDEDFIEESSAIENFRNTPRKSKDAKAREEVTGSEEEVNGNLEIKKLRRTPRKLRNGTPGLLDSVSYDSQESDLRKIDTPNKRTPNKKTPIKNIDVASAKLASASKKTDRNNTSSHETTPYKGSASKIPLKTPDQNRILGSGDGTPVYISPFVTVSRGKDRARKEFVSRASSSGGSDVLPAALLDSMSPRAAGGYFTRILNNEIEKINLQCEKWQHYKDTENPPEEGCDLIDLAIGQSKLLISKKFEQFRKLIDECGANSDEGQPIKCEDLHGFWDMVYIQVKNVNQRFENVEQMKENDWEEVVVNKPKRQVRARAAKKKATASRGLKEKILAARAMQKAGKDIQQRRSLLRSTGSPVATPNKSILKSCNTRSQKKLNKSVLFLNDLVQNKENNSFDLITFSPNIDTPSQRRSSRLARMSRSKLF